MGGKRTLWAAIYHVLGTVRDRCDVSGRPAHSIARRKQQCPPVSEHAERISSFAEWSS